MSDYQQQVNEELQRRTEEALQHAKEAGMNDEDLVLLHWHAGIPFQRKENSNA